MADLAQLERALINADAAGDSEAAKVFAGEIQRIRGQAKSMPTEPMKIGKEGFSDSLREVLGETDWGTRNIAGAGTALSNLWEGAKQFVGKGDQQAIESNNIIRDEAPVGAFVGDVALTAMPFAAAGNSLKAAGAIGAGYGLSQPVAGEQSLANIAQGKAFNTVLGGVTGAAGQKVANVVGDKLAAKSAELATQKAQNSVRDAALAKGQEAGMVVPPDMVNPSMLNKVLTGFAGKLTTQQRASSINQEKFNDLVRKEFGLAADTPLTDEVFAAYRSLRGEPYKELSALGSLPVDEAYKVGKVGPKVTGAKKQQSVFMDADGNVVSNVPPMPKQDPLTRNLMNEIIQSGGLAKAEKADLGLDPQFRGRPGLFRREGQGKTADQLVEWMQQNEWLNMQDIVDADRNAVGGSHDLARGWVKEALEGRPVFHPNEDDLAYQFGEKIAQWGEKYGDLQKTLLPGSLGKVKADDAVESLKQIRFDAKDYWKSYGRTGNPEHRKAGEALDKAASSLEQFLERSASNAGKPELVPALKAARRDIAKAHSVEKVLNDVSGNVDARKLAKNDYLTGNLKTIADFAKAFPKAAQSVEQIGSQPGISPLDFVGSGIMGNMGAMAAGPQGLLAAGVPFIRPMARSLLTSPAYQKAMAHPSYNIPVSERVAGGLLQYSPVGATALAIPAFGQ